MWLWKMQFFFPGLARKFIWYTDVMNFVRKDVYKRQEGNAVMVDVSGKNVTYRTALATGDIAVGPEIMACVTKGNVKKGDVLGVARVAGIRCV